MAKRNNDGINKSAEIRAIFAKDGKMPVKDVVATLGTRGIKVNPSLVYMMKRELKRRKRKEIGRSMEKAGMANPVELILKVRSLAGQAGGMSKLKQLVEALAQ